MSIIPRKTQYQFAETGQKHTNTHTHTHTHRNLHKNTDTLHVYIQKDCHRKKWLELPKLKSLPKPLKHDLLFV